jgi:hypothetical protein
MGPPRRSPARGTPRRRVGTIRRHSYTLLQDLGEVPEMGEGRVDYTKYTLNTKPHGAGPWG